MQPPVVSYFKVCRMSTFCLTKLRFLSLWHIFISPQRVAKPTYRDHFETVRRHASHKISVALFSENTNHKCLKHTVWHKYWPSFLNRMLYNNQNIWNIQIYNATERLLFWNISIHISIIVFIHYFVNKVLWSK